MSSVTASKILVGFWPLFYKLGEEERWDCLVPFFGGSREGRGALLNFIDFANSVLLVPEYIASSDV